MENFFYDNEYYSDIEEFMIALEIDEQNIESVPDFYRCRKGKLEPIVKLDADWIAERIDEERFSDVGHESEYDKIIEALKDVDFSKANEKIPKMWYESYEKFEITKADLYEAL